MELVARSLNSSILTFSKRPQETDRMGLLTCMSKWRKHIRRCIEEEKNKLTSLFVGLKFQLSVRVELKKLVYDENGETVQRIIDPFFTIITQGYDQHTFEDDLERMNNELLAKYDAFIENGSGYMLHTVDKSFLKLFQYRQLRGGSKLSKEIISKHACLGIDCPDERFFFV